MKIIKLLNKKILSIFIIFAIFFSNNINAEDEPADIWDLEKKVEKDNSDTSLENIDSSEINIQIENNSSLNNINIIDSKKLKDNNINIVGLYDPMNGLDMNMWSNSDGNEIKVILEKLKKKNYQKTLKRF